MTFEIYYYFALGIIHMPHYDIKFIELYIKIL